MVMFAHGREICLPDRRVTGSVVLCRRLTSRNQSDLTPCDADRRPNSAPNNRRGPHPNNLPELESGGDDLRSHRLYLALGNGFGVFADRWTAIPEFGLADTGRETILGLRLEEERRAGFAFGLDVKTARREAVGGGPEHRPELGFGWRLEGGRGGTFELPVEGSCLEPANDGFLPVHEVGLRLMARW